MGFSLCWALCEQSQFFHWAFFQRYKSIFLRLGLTPISDYNFNNFFFVVDKQSKRYHKSTSRAGFTSFLVNFKEYCKETFKDILLSTSRPIYDYFKTIFFRQHACLHTWLSVCVCVCNQPIFSSQNDHFQLVAPLN